MGENPLPPGTGRSGRESNDALA